MPAKVYGMPASGNCMGPVLVATSAGAGGLEFCNLMEGAHKQPEYLKKFPYGQVPALETDEGYCVAESNTILRYLAGKYKPELLGATLEDKAFNDWAMDVFANAVYPVAAKEVWYPVVGYTGPPADQSASNAKALEALELFKSTFLKGAFVGGEKPTLADYKIAPFLVAIAPPGLKAKIGFECPEWVLKYNEAFKAAEPAAAMLYECGGYGLHEFVQSKCA